jgi:hypothetical protein
MQVRVGIGGGGACFLTIRIAHLAGRRMTSSVDGNVAGLKGRSSNGRLVWPGGAPE